MIVFRENKPYILNDVFGVVISGEHKYCFTEKTTYGYAFDDYKKYKYKLYKPLRKKINITYHNYDYLINNNLIKFL